MVKIKQLDLPDVEYIKLNTIMNVKVYEKTKKHL